VRRRPSARLLLLDRDDRVLMFRFVFNVGALADQDYWATPGGALEAGESFADAARRELSEETGITVDSVGSQVAAREFVLQLPDGEHVLADERFYLLRTADQTLSRDGWTPLEVEVMVDHRWWSMDELRATTAVVYPENLVGMLATLVTPAC